MLRKWIQQPISAWRYLILGFVLFAVKFQLDRVIALFFHRPWSLNDYWHAGSYEALIARQPAWNFLLSMAGVALPFIAIGIVLTIRRLRTIAWPLWLSILFFVPAVNLLLFLLLLAWPTHPKSYAELSALDPNWLRDRLPEKQLGAAIAGVLATVPYAILIVMFSTTLLKEYSSGLFLGLPFVMGFVATSVYNAKHRHGLGSSLFVSVCSVMLLGMVLTMVAIEGFFCLLMAIPIAVPLALGGSLVAYLLCGMYRTAGPDLAVGMVLLLPGMLVTQHARHPAPEFAVRTSVIVHAAPETVWRNLIGFALLPPPTEWMFRAGIAYPTRAQIDGIGAGATRHCIFSTGAFVEPIRVWEEPRLLAFDVAAEPPALQELSPYHHLDPPHLRENYLRSRHGRFLLTPLPGGDTKLEGTTWYELRFWPSSYWHLWSDAIIHRIHQRVLDHIKLQAERGQRESPNGFDLQSNP